ncbi:hypothetical protein [Aquimarina latercula]|uniref:hypothetical protein n=1 Tax=Aquimarina latercula TaxID=987 RepID=UPI001B7F9092|nr:hypothetical protein [Aquimarina latercula]
MFSKIGRQIESYLKLGFPDQHLQLLSNNDLESFIDFWESDYYDNHKELIISSYSENQYMNESEQKYNYQNIALCKVFNKISDTFKRENSQNKVQK